MIKITWDGKPVRQEFAPYNVVCGGVAVTEDGKCYGVNATATLGCRHPEIELRHMTPSRRGARVAEGQLPQVRGAVRTAWCEILAPMRAAYVAAAHVADMDYVSERQAHFSALDGE